MMKSQAFRLHPERLGSTTKRRTATRSLSIVSRGGTTAEQSSSLAFRHWRPFSVLGSPMGADFEDEETPRPVLTGKNRTAEEANLEMAKNEIRRLRLEIAKVKQELREERRKRRK